MILSEMDYLFFMNANMKIVDIVDESILPKDNECGITSTIHPGYYRNKNSYNSLKKIIVKDKYKSISIEPTKLSLDIDFELKYENQLIGNQQNKINVYEDNLQDIFDSRTFCLFEDIEKLKEMGLAQGGSLENAIVVKENEILNEKGLRNKKEFVNHKILDCMGDLYLAGYKIIGKIVCSQGGHKLTNQLLRKVFQQDENFSLIEITEKHLPNTFINKSHLRSIA